MIRLPLVLAAILIVAAVLVGIAYVAIGVLRLVLLAARQADELRAYRRDPTAALRVRRHRERLQIEHRRSEADR